MPPPPPGTLRGRRDKLKFLSILGSTALLIGATAVSAADLSAVRGAAAAAFGTGEYSNSARLYSQTREAALKNGDERAWLADTVAMARAYLHAGDTERAKQLLAELAGRDSGILAGEIMAAEGRVDEAKKFFRSLADDPKAGRMNRGEAALALSYLLLISGDAAERAEALKVLEALEKHPHFAPEARLRRVRALIDAGRDRQALVLASDVDFGDETMRRRLELLKLLAHLRTGQADVFDAGWSKLRNRMLPRPDRLAFDALDQAAAAAVKASRPDRAASYWKDAYGFADGDDARRDALRKLFNCCATRDARTAADAAKRYLEIFPKDASGEQLAELARMLSGAGRALSAAGAYREALEFFQLVADDGKMPIENRRAAAEDAALAAERAGDQDTAKRYFESLVSAAENRTRLQLAQLSYAEYMIRRKDFSGAERLLSGMDEATVPAHKDRATRLLMQTLAEQKKFDAALVEAEKLRRSADPAAAGLGDFQAALLTENLGRPAEARERYLKYVERYPKGEFVRPARFAAAKMAEESGDYAAAAREFLAYVEASPNDPDLSSALFWALRDGGLAGDRKTALKAFEALKLRVGIGPEYYAAVLQLADFLRRSGGAAEALKLLDDTDRSKCDASVNAMLDLMRAKVLAAAGSRDKAIEAVKKLLEEHPAESAAADAAFLGGGLYLEEGNPDEAMKLFDRARQLRPSGAFGEAAAVRIAECRVEKYNQKNDRKDLETATEEFGRLAGEATVPDIRLMCGYRLGRCREMLNDPRAAVNAYHQTLLYAGELRRAHRLPNPKWCSLSAYAALYLLLQQTWSDVDQRGAEILDAVSSLDLPGSRSEFEEVRKKFSKRHLNNREI